MEENKIISSITNISFIPMDISYSSRLPKSVYFENNTQDLQFFSTETFIIPTFVPIITKLSKLWCNNCKSYKNNYKKSSLNTNILTSNVCENCGNFKQLNYSQFVDQVKKKSIPVPDDFSFPNFDNLISNVIILLSPKLSELIYKVPKYNEIIKLNKNTKGKQKALVKYVSGKHGFIRANLSGKRSNFSSRAVIVPDCYIPIDFMMVPFFVRDSVSISTKYNKSLLNIITPLFLSNSKNKYNLENLVSMRDDSFIVDTKVLNSETNFHKTIENSYVILNRQPTLSKDGVLSIKHLYGNGYCFRLNPMYVTSLAGDFDGDAVNIYKPQDRISELELHNTNSIRNMYQRKIIYLTYEGLTGSYILHRTKKDKNIIVEKERIGILTILQIEGCETSDLLNLSYNEKTMDILIRSNSKIRNKTMEKRYKTGLSRQELLDESKLARISQVSKGVSIADIGSFNRKICERFRNVNIRTKIF